VDEVLDIESVVRSQAAKTARRYAGFVEADDLAQEGWVWIIEHPQKVKVHQETEEVSLAAYRLGQDLWKAMESYARREKASASGYEPEDELYFSHSLINLVLPSVLKDDPTPPVQAGERVANTSDPAEGGTWLATYLDVKQAWEKAPLTEAQRDLLEMYYFEEATQQEIADDLGTTQQTVAKRLKAARRKLIDRLGGPEPKEYNTEHDSRPGVKRNEPGIVSQVT
jgi:RNA polymerase sigma factor (sigma-70 family)